MRLLHAITWYLIRKATLFREDPKLPKVTTHSEGDGNGNQSFSAGGHRRATFHKFSSPMIPVEMFSVSNDTARFRILGPHSYSNPHKTWNSVGLLLFPRGIGPSAQHPVDC